MPLVSIVIPVFNEERTLLTLLDRVRSAPLPEGVTCEWILVDDCSRDGSPAILAALPPDPRLKVLTHPRNGGKGAALHTGFSAAQGDWILIQDADLEYSPQDYPQLLAPLVAGTADVVYGSRFLANSVTRVHHYSLHRLANLGLTWLSNLLSGLRLTDMETCYKVFRRDILATVVLHEPRFGFEPEFSAHLGRLARREGLRIAEVPISYHGRSYAEGKKIKFSDALEALYCIVRYNLLARFS